MTLKLTEEQLKELDDSEKAYFKDGVFSPKADNSEALKAEITELKAKNADTKEQLEAKEQALIEALKNTDAEKVAALEASYKEKFDRLDSEKSKLDLEISESLRKSALKDIATQLGGTDSSLQKYWNTTLNDRVAIDTSTGERKISILKDGKPSALTIDELIAEQKADKENERFIVGSQASGAGGFNQSNGGKQIKSIDKATFNSMSYQEKSDFFKTGGELEAA